MFTIFGTYVAETFSWYAFLYDDITDVNSTKISYKLFEDSTFFDIITEFVKHFNKAIECFDNLS